MDKSPQVVVNETLADVVRAMQSKHSQIRQSAMRATADYPPGSTEVVSSLIGILTGQCPSEDRQLAAEMLGYHGTENNDVIATLTSVLSDKDDRVKICAAQALIRAGGSVDRAILILVLCFSSKDAWSRHEAIVVVGRIGPDARLAATALADIVCNKNDHRKHAAIRALRYIKPDPSDVAECLCRLLPTCITISDSQLLAEILLFLRDVGVSRECVPHLVASLRRTDPETGYMKNFTASLSLPGHILTLDFHEEIIRLLSDLGGEAEEAKGTLEEICEASLSSYGAGIRQHKLYAEKYPDIVAAYEAIPRQRWLRRTEALEKINAHRKEIAVFCTTEDAKQAAKNALLKIC